ncbi:MAG: hypothetical protein K2M76_00615, partial [Muribaculaceae bacterium]|nr:hypothetical protein [Muribaculaceae bacterium]
MLLYPAVTIIMFAIGIYATNAGGPVLSLLSVGLMSSILSFMVYFAPCVLTRRNTRRVELMLPASALEKSIVLLAYFLIIIPAISTGLYQLLNYIATHWFNQPCILDLTSSITNDEDFSRFMSLHSSIAYIASLTQGATYILTSLWCVLYYRINRTLKAIIWSVVAMVAVSMISGIFTVLSIISDHASDIVKGNLDETAINHTVNDTLTMLMPTMAAICGIYCIFAIWMIWRQFAKRQI